ncbi:MAG: NAD-dependent epimerase [Bacteroidetes bacterium]|nr:MAG: NAD-dependent epimerase [Bacteroidota bacterium]
MIKILVTGVAGFIGFHAAQKLLALGFQVVGIDNLNTYYDIQLKIDRLKELGISRNSEDFIRQVETQSGKHPSFSFLQQDIVHREQMFSLFEKHKFDVVIHLAAQAGVRYSLEKPEEYIQANVVGFANVLEASRKHKVGKLLYASSSSVYGNKKEGPFKESDQVDEPYSMYAATKKSNELMAFTYSHLYQMDIIGLRFFTVYGPWGRPDMAAFLFTNAILNSKPIQVFNYGDLWRDFTFVDDIVKAIAALVNKESIKRRHEIFNIGNGHPVKLLDFISTLEGVLQTKANLKLMPMQDGDVHQTFASTAKLQSFIDFSPEVNIQEGLQRFADWYKSYY